MKKQLLKTMLCLSAIGMVNTMNAQFALLEAPGTGSQDVGRTSASNGNLYFVGREQGGSPTTNYLWSNNGTTSTKITAMSQLSQGINASYFFPCGGKNYFFYSNGNTVSGYEPWVTDGTAGGTVMIKDINPGTGNSVLGNGLQDCFCYNNKVYFGADNGVNGNELWESDGTLAGTNIVKDIKVGSTTSSIGSIVNYKGKMFFTAKSGTWLELWYSDGTAVGTQPVTSPTGLTSYQGSLVAHDTCLYFSGTNSGGNIGLWKTNGTTAGTSSVNTSILPMTPLNSIYSITSAGPNLLFGYQYVSGGWQNRLYKSDGLTITLVKDSMSFKNPIYLNNKVVYNGEKTGSSTGGEPWVTDATTPGTFKLNPISWASSGTWRNVSPVFNNKVYFGTTGSIWETDGTVSGTALNTSSVGTVYDFTMMGTELFCDAQNPANGNRMEVYKLGASTAGINEANVFENNMSLYPQPTSDHVTIKFNSDVKEVELRLMDLTGKELRTEKQIADNGTIELNFADLNEGMYLLNIKSSDGRSATKKLMISK